MIHAMTITGVLILAQFNPQMDQLIQLQRQQLQQQQLQMQQDQLNRYLDQQRALEQQRIIQQQRQINQLTNPYGR